MRARIVVMACVAVLAGAVVAQAGEVEPPAGPASGASGMYTLEDIWQRLDNGAAGAVRAGAFTEPVVAPGTPTMHSTDDIMGAAPAVDDTNGAGTGEVMAGRSFWGLRSGGGWGLLSGTLATQVLSAGSTAVAAGYYGATALHLVDTDLAIGNIRRGVTLFGIAGDLNVVNTSSGDAVAADLASGKKAWVDGAEVTGTATAGGGAGVPKTKQEACWDASVTSMACAGTGQDGDHKKGVAWPNPRFTKNGNGTVTDNLTGLIWLENANCGGTMLWANALTFANSLYDGWTGAGGGDCGLSDGSVAGDWRLPNVREQQSLIDYAYSSPAVPNTAGDGKWSSGDPFTNVQSDWYWTSSTFVSFPSIAWVVSLGAGYVYANRKGYYSYVWPVRGGS